MDGILICASWAFIGFVFGVGGMLWLMHHAPVTDEEKRVLIHRWQDELDASMRDRYKAQ